jgi:Ricin-type beta-trefoil lectin domain-like
MRSIKVILFIALALCLSVEAGKGKKKQVVKPAEIQLKTAQGDYKGIYTIVNKNSGQVISVQDDSMSNGAKIVTYGSGSHSAQQWKLYYNNGYYSLQAVHSGKWLDCPGLSTADGTQMIQWDWNGGKNQLWAWQGVSAQYGFWNSKNSGKVLDASGWGIKDNTAVIQWPAKSGNDANNQLWTWVRVGTN